MIFDFQGFLVRNRVYLMGMKTKQPKVIDMTPLYRKYPGKFVALTPDHRKFIAAMDTLSEALREARARGIEHPLVERIPWEARSYLL